MNADLKAATQKLRVRVETEDDFGKIFGAFFDLSMMPGFLEQSEQVEHDLLVQVLRSAGSSALGKAIRRLEVLPLRVSGTELMHGAGSMDGRSLAFFYFTDLGKGLMALYPGLKPGETLFTRITAVVLPARSNVIFPEKTELH